MVPPIRAETIDFSYDTTQLMHSHSSDHENRLIFSPPHDAPRASPSRSIDTKWIQVTPPQSDSQAASYHESQTESLSKLGCKKELGRKSALDTKTKQSAAKMRIVKACVRCRLSKQTVSLNII